MAVELIMPKLGMSMVEGTIVVWKKKIGDPIIKGDGIVDISSEKIEMEVESPADGILLDITVAEGGIVPYGTVLGYVGQPDEKVEKKLDATLVTTANQEAVDSVAEHQVVSIPVANERSSVKISPIARKMAEEAGLNLDSIVGTGPQGRITKEDVEKVLENGSKPLSVPEEKSPKEQIEYTQTVGAQELVESTPVTGIRKVIAMRMQESLQQSAQLTLTMKADLTDLLLLQKQMAPDVEKRFEIKLTVTDFISRAVVLALLQHKQINSAYIEDRIETYGHNHLGIAVAVEKGLVVPVIRHAERCSLIELSKSIKSLSQRARINQLSSEEMKGSTFTITNLGAYGVEHFTPVLNPPEAGILGVGVIEDVPVFRGEELQRRSMLPLSLTFDHRVLDGAPAAQFLGSIKSYLEEPFNLLL